MTTTSQSKNPRTRRRQDVGDAVSVILENGLAPGELMRVLDLSQPWVTRARAAGLPRRKDNRHDLPAVLKWIRERERERPPAPTAGESPELERWRRARADVAEIDLEQRRGELVSREEVIDAIVTAIYLVKQRLGDARKKLSPRLYQAPSIEWIDDQLGAEFDALLTAFAHGCRNATPGVPAAAQTNLPPGEEPGTTTIEETKEA